MHYDSGIGCYTNTYLERILDTQFYYGVPYHIDKDKYNDIILNYVGASNFDDIVVTFSVQIEKDEEDNDNSAYVFFIHPENDLDEDNYQYDCISFYSTDYDGAQRLCFTEFVISILNCVIEPSIQDIQKAKGSIINNINKELKYIKKLDKIISQNLIHNNDNKQ